MARKRCFEALEDRRLLSDVPGASTAASTGASDGDGSPNYVESAPAAAPPNGAASGNAVMPNASSAAAAAESPGEYAAATGDAAAASNASSPIADAAYATEYSSNASSYSSYATPYYTPAQTAAIESLAAALGNSNQPSQINLVSPASALVNAVATTAPAVPAAPAGAVRWSANDLVMRSESQQPFAVARQPFEESAGVTEELADAIALLEPGKSETPPTADEPTTEAELEGVATAAESAAPQPAGLLTGTIAANIGLIERNADALFERLDRLGAELANRVGPRQLGQALMAVAGAAAAWEYARARRREHDDGRMVGNRGAPRELQLPRRLSRRRGIL